MKLFFLSILLIFPLIGTSQLSIHNFFERTNTFLETHTHEGRVNYPAIVRNSNELNALLGFIENVDRVARGTGLVTFNAEYLYTVLKHKWAFCQLGAFTDIAYLRPGEAALAETFKSENSYYYSGLSLRLQTRILYRAVIRFDYGFNLQDVSQGGFTVGFNHFF
ncbi:MAG: hypothetical protein ACJAUJ_001639 [Salibacteraceae bacterium]|jgi:hypothetical protein